MTAVPTGDRVGHAPPRKSRISSSAWLKRIAIGDTGGFSVQCLTLATASLAAPRQHFEEARDRTSAGPAPENHLERVLEPALGTDCRRRFLHGRGVDFTRLAEVYRAVLHRTVNTPGRGGGDCQCGEWSLDEPNCTEHQRHCRWTCQRKALPHPRSGPVVYCRVPEYSCGLGREIGEITAAVSQSERVRGAIRAIDQVRVLGTSHSDR